MAKPEALPAHPQFNAASECARMTQNPCRIGQNPLVRGLRGDLPYFGYIGFGECWGMKRNVMAFGLGILLMGAMSLPAKADLKLCNNTTSTVQIAVGYKDKEGWASEGWWTAKPQACINLLKGSLIARFYYVYAVDRDKGGSWGGKAMICMKDKIFTIRGIDHCTERGYQQQGFFEVDTGEKTDWTISLSGDKQAPAVNGVATPPATDPTKPADPAKPATTTP